MDGYIARKFHIESKIGALLDSMADLVFYLVITTIFVIWFNALILEYLVYIIIIICIRFSNCAFSLAKYRHITFIHTWMNKLNGILVFLFPFFMFYFPSKIYIHLVIFISIVSSAEELLINIISSKPDLNRRSLFFK